MVQASEAGPERCEHGAARFARAVLARLGSERGSTYRIVRLAGIIPQNAGLVDFRHRYALKSLAEGLSQSGTTAARRPRGQRALDALDPNYRASNTCSTQRLRTYVLQQLRL